jgi:hypothetical protein
MFFQAKNTFEKHLEVVAEVMLNSIVYVVLTWWVQIWVINIKSKVFVYKMNP